jgi:hypothetical protein
MAGEVGQVVGEGRQHVSFDGANIKEPVEKRNVDAEKPKGEARVPIE